MDDEALMRLFSWLLVLGFLGFGIFFPMLQLASYGGLSSSSWELFLKPSTLSLVKMTVFQAGLSALMAGGLGLVLGLFFSRAWSPALANAARRILPLPYLAPSLLICLMGAIYFHPRSFLGSFVSYSWSAVIAAHVFMNAPWIALRVALARNQISLESFAAARSLGASS